jgi:vitamin B12 transporter
MNFPVSRQAAAPAFALPLVLPLALSLASLFAASAASADSIADTVVVTATRTPQRADEVIADTLVIDEAEIARAGAGSIADVLRRQRGIEIVRNGGAGTSTSVYLRGANSNQVVVLVDGVRIGSSTTGGASWNAIPLSTIERIEVVYGPLSSLYGADAIGGVVQIFTKKGSGAPAFSASAGGGTYGTRQGEASLTGSSGGAHAISYSIAGEHETSSGFSATRPGAFGYNPDDDGYRRNSISGRVAMQLADGHEIGAQLLQSRVRAQYDSSSASFDTHNIQDVDSYALFLNDRFLPNWRSSVQAARSFDKLGSFTSAAASGVSQLNTRQDELTWQNTIGIGLDTLQVLANHRKEEVVSSSTAVLSRARITNSLAASYDMKRGSHLFDLSVRDDDSDYGSKTTGALGYGYEFARGLRATASFGTSFRAPTFNELYYPGYGLPTNKPEKGRNLEAGLHYDLAGTELQANYYRNRVTDLIVSASPCPSPTITGSCAYNVDHALLEGLTLSAERRLGDLHLRASADLQDPRDETTDKLLARRARRHASVSADYAFGQLDAGAELQASGERYDDAANRNRLGGYGLLNLTTDWRLARDWSVLVRLDNATGKRYELARFYGTAGRSWFAALRYGFL